MKLQQKIIINDYPIEAINVKFEHEKHYKLSFDFIVTHDQYHDVTTILYKKDFTVEVPHENIQFSAVISNYATSVTNLYEIGAEGEFHLELIEKE